jgi:pilus assembly protein CpaB
MKKIYLVALVLALITGLAVYGFANSLQRAAARDYTEVVVAAMNIPERTVLVEDMLVLRSIPSESVLPSAVTSIDQVIGLFNDNAMEPGEILSSAKLHTKGETASGLTYIIPDGKRAFTFSVDAVSGVAGFILPGDHVDIIATLTIPETESTASTAGATSVSSASGADDAITVLIPTSLVISQNVEVLAAGTSITAGTAGLNSAYTTITVAVTLEEAVQLNLAAVNGRLRMVLRSPLDKEIVDILPQTMESLGKT